MIRLLEAGRTKVYNFIEMELTSRFEQALVYTTRLHTNQRRKSTDVPYISHLLSTAALVLEFGGDEDEAIAALLHDAVEDQGGLPILDEIRGKFGVRVAHIVEECTDAFTTPKPPWLNRKENYLQRLRDAPLDVRRVSLADKLHNARSLLASLRLEGAQVWQRFKGGREGTLWYYQALAEVFQATGGDEMTDEFSRVVAAIQVLA